MLYRVMARYEFERNMQEVYDQLIEDGYLPDEARKQVEHDLREEIERIGNRAANVICGYYEEEYIVEELSD